MLYREIIAVCSQIHTKHINTLCGQNVELFTVKPGGTYSNHRAFEVCSFIAVRGGVSDKIKKRTVAVVDKSNKRKSGKEKVNL